MFLAHSTIAYTTAWKTDVYFKVSDPSLFQVFCKYYSLIYPYEYLFSLLVNVSFSPYLLKNVFEFIRHNINSFRTTSTYMNLNSSRFQTYYSFKAGFIQKFSLIISDNKFNLYVLENTLWSFWVARYLRRTIIF